MSIVQIGKKFESGYKNLPEGLLYEYGANDHVIIINFPNITQQEIDAFRNNETILAAYNRPPALFLLLMIEGFIDWSDMPFNWHLVHPELKAVPKADYPKGSGAIVRFILVDSNTKIVKALRVIGAGTRFSNFVEQCILEQIKNPLTDKPAYHQYCGQIQNQLSPAEMALKADISYTAQDKGEFM